MFCACFIGRSLYSLSSKDLNNIMTVPDTLTIGFRILTFFLPLAVAYLNMGQLLATMGRCEEAESVLKVCASLDGSHSKDPVNHETSRMSALVTLGKLHADRGRYLDAVQAYKHAVSILPPYYNSRVSLVVDFPLSGEISWIV